MSFVELSQVDGTFDTIEGVEYPVLCTHTPDDFRPIILAVRETERDQHFFPALECRVCGGIWILTKYEREFAKATGGI